MIVWENENWCDAEAIWLWMIDKQDWLRNNDFLSCSLLVSAIQHIFSSKSVLTKISDSAESEKWFYLCSKYMWLFSEAFISEQEMHENVATA